MARERPMLFSGPMVRALLSGAKTQTRRLVDMRRVGFIGGAGQNDDPGAWGFGDINGCWHVLDRGAPAWTGVGVPHESYRISSPLGEPGDRLWVRETWRAEERNTVDGVVFAADDTFTPIAPTREAAERWVAAYRRNGRWRPSIHMARWASRLTLEITGVRVERLQHISEQDAHAEGVRKEDVAVGNIRACFEMGALRYQFANMWDALYANSAPWESSPWVWVISFKRVEVHHG